MEDEDARVSLLVGSVSERWEPTVLQLADILDDVLQRIDDRALDPQAAKVELEVEGRVGVVMDPSNDQRLELPFENEVVLRPPEGGFSYRFEPGLPQDTWRSLNQAIARAVQESNKIRQASAQTTGRQPSSHPRPPLPVCLGSVSKSTVDEFHQHPMFPRGVRVSFLSNQQGGAGGPSGPVGSASSEPIEVVSKENFAQLTVWTGRSEEGDGYNPSVAIAAANAPGGPTDSAIITASAAAAAAVQSGGPRVDFRIAVNLEHKVAFRPGHGSSKLNARLKNRDTINFEHMKIDASEVHPDQTGKTPGSKVSYELEVELEPKLLEREIRLRREGKPHRLFHILTDFICILRDWCAYVNSPATDQDANTAASSAPGGQPAKPGAPGGPAGGAGGGGVQYEDLRDCSVNKELLGAYLRHVSPVMPIIGDYMFRAVAADLAAGNRPIHEIEEENFFA